MFLNDQEGYFRPIKLSISLQTCKKCSPFSVIFVYKFLITAALNLVRKFLNQNLFNDRSQLGGLNPCVFFVIDYSHYKLANTLHKASA
jgi:hypothetical protein